MQVFLDDFLVAAIGPPSGGWKYILSYFSLQMLFQFEQLD